MSEPGVIMAIFLISACNFGVPPLQTDE